MKENKIESYLRDDGLHGIDINIQKKQGRSSKSPDEIRRQASLAEAQRLSESNQPQSDQGLKQIEGNLHKEQKKRELLEKRLSEKEFLLKKLYQTKIDIVNQNKEKEKLEADLARKESELVQYRLNAAQKEEKVQRLETTQQKLKDQLAEEKSKLQPLNDHIAALYQQKQSLKTAITKKNSEIQRMESVLAAKAMDEILTLVEESNEHVLDKKTKDEIKILKDTLYSIKEFSELCNTKDGKLYLEIDDNVEKLKNNINTCYENLRSYGVSLPTIESFYPRDLSVKSIEDITHYSQRYKAFKEHFDQMKEKWRQLDATSPDLHESRRSKTNILKNLREDWCRSQINDLEQFISQVEKISPTNTKTYLEKLQTLYQTFRGKMLCDLRKDESYTNFFDSSNNGVLFTEEHTPGFFATDDLYNKLKQHPGDTVALEEAKSTKAKLADKLNQIIENSSDIQREKQTLLASLASREAEQLKKVKESYHSAKLVSLEMSVIRSFDQRILEKSIDKLARKCYLDPLKTKLVAEKASMEETRKSLEVNIDTKKAERENCKEVQNITAIHTAQKENNIQLSQARLDYQHVQSKLERSQQEFDLAKQAVVGFKQIKDLKEIEQQIETAKSDCIELRNKLASAKGQEERIRTELASAKDKEKELSDIVATVNENPYLLAFLKKIQQDLGDSFFSKSVHEILQ